MCVVFWGEGAARLGFPGITSGKEPTCQFRRRKRCEFDPWVGGDPLEKEILQYSCLENPMDRGPGGLLSMGSHRVGHD